MWPQRPRPDSIITAAARLEVANGPTRLVARICAKPADDSLMAGATVLIPAAFHHDVEPPGPLHRHVDDRGAEGVQRAQRAFTRMPRRPVH